MQFVLSFRRHEFISHKSTFFPFFFLNFSPQMEVDGPLSAQEQIIILYDIKLQCQQNLSNTDTEVTGKKKKKRKKEGLEHDW